MGKLKLMVDTNVIVDYLQPRPEFFDNARLLMLCGRLGEFDLWATGSQMTDALYILSGGGQQSLLPSTLQSLRGMRQFMQIWPIGPVEIDTMLRTIWKDPEDALIYDAALRLGADAIVTRDKKGFEQSSLPVMDCEELFQWLEAEFDLVYAEMAL